MKTFEQDFEWKNFANKKEKRYALDTEVNKDKCTYPYASHEG
jgi:hypothetical protein